MTQPLVSILIPAYNAEPFIAQTLESALAQTWPRTEIIVVDDGSSDRTFDVARQFASDRVTVVTQRNKGAAAARNYAVSLSRGDFIQWLDADDLLAPDKISRQLEAIRDYRDTRLLLSSGWGHFLYRSRKARFRPSPLWADLTPLEWLLRKMEHNAHMQPATWLVSRELANAAGPWDTRLLGDDDGEYFCRVISASRGIRFVPDARIYYRITGGASLSYVGESDRKLEAQFLSCKLHVDYVLALADDERSRAACVTYLQKYMAMFFERRPDIVTEMQVLAARLGGELQPPSFPWKYAWIQRLFGWSAAARSRRVYNNVKGRSLRFVDKMIFDLERQCFGQF
jgi:glycosyltransferase involved in cell wall biosynthesis